jgi:ribosomal protein S12 methylthiotransferase accessory factor
MGDSLKKALLEVSQLPPWIRYAYQKEPNWTCRDDFLDINNFDDHGQLYTRRRDLIEKAFSFLKRTKRKKGYKNPQLNIRSHGEKLKHCINILQKHGYDIIMCDLSTSDVKDAGFKVVRIVVPGLIPLHGDHRYPFLGGQRLYKVPRKLGLRKLVNEISVNPYPHPSA